MAGLGLVPILTDAATKLTVADPPAVRVTDAGKKAGIMLLTPVPGSRPLVLTTAEKLTVPAKDPVLVRVSVATADPPLGTLSKVGVAARLKSDTGTTTDSVAPPVIDSE